MTTRYKRLKRAETEQSQESNPEGLQTVFEQKTKKNKNKNTQNKPKNVWLMEEITKRGGKKVNYFGN